MEIPKDEFGSGHTDLECFAKLYAATLEELKEKIQKYFAQYSYGYGIHYRRGYSPQKHAGGYWHCIIDRWHSCE